MDSGILHEPEPPEDLIASQNASFSSQIIENSHTLSPRSRRHLGKAETASTARAVILHAENQELQEQITSLTVSKRTKKPKKTLNRVVANRAGIKKAYWQSSLEQAHKTQEKAEKALAEIERKEAVAKVKNRTNRKKTKKADLLIVDGTAE